jgi:hypothetical protein
MISYLLSKAGFFPKTLKKEEEEFPAHGATVRCITCLPSMLPMRVPGFISCTKSQSQIHKVADRQFKNKKRSEMKLHCQIHKSAGQASKPGETPCHANFKFQTM